MVEIFLPLIGGLIILFVGGELLVSGSSSLAMWVGLSPLVIGLTVVAFGTSGPELVVSVHAALKGNSAISIGNVIGSNIANIGLILGISAIIRPIRVQSDAVSREIPFMIIISFIFSALILRGKMGFITGFFFIVLLVVYTAYAIYHSHRNNSGEQTGQSIGSKRSLPASVFFVILGLGGLALGSDLFIDGAVRLARALKVSEFFIGLTVVAVGTSLPELVTSIVASMKKESDILVGNLVGSNIFNILAIVGIASMIASIRLPQVDVVDILTMLSFSTIILPMSISARSISRKEGFVLLGGYCAYIYYLMLSD